MSKQKLPKVEVMLERRKDSIHTIMQSATLKRKTEGFLHVIFSISFAISKEGEDRKRRGGESVFLFLFFELQ